MMKRVVDHLAEVAILVAQLELRLQEADLDGVQVTLQPIESVEGEHFDAIRIRADRGNLVTAAHLSLPVSNEMGLYGQLKESKT